MRALHGPCTLLLRAALVAALAPAFSFPLHSQTVDARQQLEDLSSAISLDRAGMAPWHLHMTFQLHDLTGQPVETGTIEEWWSSPQTHRLVITSPSYNATDSASAASSAAPLATTREAFLVRELLDQVVHPIPRYGTFDKLKVTQIKRTFGKAELSCLTVSPADRTAQDRKNDALFCTEPNTSILRARLDNAQFTAVRNKMATFRGIELGLDNTLAYGPVVAITGHVDALDAYQSSAPDPPASSSSASSSSASDDTHVPAAVQAAKLLTHVAPKYPEAARRQHLGGFVVLCGVISKQGTVTSLDVVASPSSVLSEAALEAVKQWTYQPYVLNGEPTELETTITVNFNLN